MARLGLGRQHRRVPHGRGGFVHTPWFILCVCLVGAILLTVLVGNILRLTLSEEVYNRLTQGEPETEPEVPEQDPAYKAIRAPAFRPGDAIDALAGRTAASLLLNLPDGKTTYTSPVSLYQGLAEENGTPLEDTMIDLASLIPYVSGLYLVQGASAESADLRYAKAMEEGALLREFYRMGGREVVLSGIPFASLDLRSILSYVSAVKQGAGGELPIGVAIPLTVAEGEDAWELLGSLLEVCDFLVLDLSEEVTDPQSPTNDFGVALDVAEILSRAEFYRTQYRMRLLIAEDQTTVYDALQYRLIMDWQVKASLS